MRSISASILLTSTLMAGRVANPQDGKDTLKTREEAFILALMGQHFTALNELDPEKRRGLITQVYDPHVKLVDPHIIVDGRAELEKLYDVIHQQFPGGVFRVIDDIDVHHEVARIHWELAKPGASEKQTGDDIVRIKEGKIVEIIVFFNRTNQASPEKPNHR